MIFDTDILIWIQRGHVRAADLVGGSLARKISLQSYLELIQYSKNKLQQAHTRAFLKEADFEILPLTENIGHRAVVYLEEYGLSSGLGAGDALIAATATEMGEVLCTSNGKHFRNIRELRLKIFRP